MIRVLQGVFLRPFRAIMRDVNGLSVIDAQLKSSGCAGRKSSIRFRMAFSIYQARFNTAGVARAGGLVLVLSSGRIIRLFYHVRRARHASHRFCDISFSAAQEWFRVLLIRYVLCISEHSAVAKRLSEIRPRARKVAFFAPSECTACVNGYLGLFLCNGINCFA